MGEILLHSMLSLKHLEKGLHYTGEAFLQKRETARQSKAYSHSANGCTQTAKDVLVLTSLRRITQGVL